MNSNKQQRAFLGMSLISELAGVRGRQLMQYLGSAERAWEANAAEMRAAGLEEKHILLIQNKKKDIDLDAEMKRLEAEQIRLIGWGSEEYPESLKHIASPPLVLYIKGEITAADLEAVGIVGARRATPYGRKVAERIATDLAHEGITVISGLAFGIDGAAHSATLAAGPDARTIGVLGCGLDWATLYPKENRALAEKIIAGRGALISEYPIGTPPLKHHFPARNRIISALSRGVVVIEATETSGSLITAEFALEQGKEVFAVPGSIFDKNSAGPHKLIQKGAKLITSTQDIFDELYPASVVRASERGMAETGIEQEILVALEDGQKHIDELVTATSQSVTDVNVGLVRLEMKGLVSHMGVGNYIRN